MHGEPAMYQRLGGHTLTATGLPRHCASKTLPKPPCPCSQPQGFDTCIMILQRLTCFMQSCANPQACLQRFPPELQEGVPKVCRPYSGHAKLSSLFPEQAHQAGAQLWLDLSLKVHVHVDVGRRGDPHGDWRWKDRQWWQVGGRSG